MDILIACDKYKGSLDAVGVCQAISDGILTKYPMAKIDILPLADGGDGTLEVLESSGGFESRSSKSLDPKGRSISTRYLSKGRTAFIELATSSGIAHLTPDERDILNLQTVGTGQLFREAVESGHQEIILAIGGSCTNDMGLGIASELGFVFLDEYGESLAPIGFNLGRVKKVIRPDKDISFKLRILCDVDNPLYGSNGAAQVYGPQKGASKEEIAFLDKGMEHFAGVIKTEFHRDVSELKGGGAAGGIAAGLFGLIDGTTLLPGFEFVAETLDLKNKIEQASLIITGEGKLDEQSLNGKVLSGVASFCTAAEKPLWAIVGKNELSQEQLMAFGISEVKEVRAYTKSKKEAMERAALVLRTIGNELKLESFLKGTQ